MGVAPPARPASPAEVRDLGAAGRAVARRCEARAEGQRRRSGHRSGMLVGAAPKDGRIDLPYRVQRHSFDLVRAGILPASGNSKRVATCRPELTLDSDATNLIEESRDAAWSSVPVPEVTSARRRSAASSPRSSPMPAQSVDPRIDDGREQPAVEGDAHGDAGEEGEGELDPAHRRTEAVTARTYPVGDPGVGVDRTSAPSCPQACGRWSAAAIRLPVRLSAGPARPRGG